MMNLVEIMQAAQGGNAYSNLAEKFGIPQEQAQQAVQAVLPAISLGLQQQAQTIEGWQNILKTLGTSQASAETFDSDGDGIPDALEEEGHSAVGTMFGAPEVSQAVAQQAAQFAGLPASIMQQMLPVIASMVMGGLVKGATNAGLGGLLGQMMQNSLGQMMGGQPQAQGNIFGNILGQMMGAGQPQAQGNIFGNILGQMMGAGQPAPQPQSMDPVAAGLEALKSMFQTGQQVHAQHMDALTQIVSQLGKKE